MRRLALAFAALLALGACTGAFENIGEPARLILAAETDEERAAARQAVLDDVREALRSAEVHDDKIAAACWRGILAKLDGINGSYFTDVKGAASGFQKARNVRRLVTNFSEDVQIACAALRADTRSAFLGVFRLVGLPVL